MKKLIIYLFIFEIFIYGLSILLATDFELLSQSERAALINQARCEYAEEQIQQGNENMLEQDYFSASKHYYNALESILQENATFTKLRDKAIHLLCTAITLLTAENNSTTLPPSSERENRLINKILAKTYPSYCSELINLSIQFRNNQPHSYIYPEQIKENLRKATIDYHHEAWENALTDYKKVLSLDKTNAIALLGIELIHQKEKKDVTMTKKTRNDMLTDIDKAWNLPSVDTTLDSKLSLELNQNEEHLLKKLHTLIIPQVDFNYISITEAIKELRHQACLADYSETNPNKKGINIVLKLTTSNDSRTEKNIHLSLKNVPLEEIITYLSQQANLSVKVEPYAVILTPIDDDESRQPLLIQEYKVPPDFFNLANSDSIKQETNTPVLEKELLTSQGITFPKGASAHYFSDSNILIVKNTSPNLNLIASLIKNATDHPPLQVEIETRFIEVKQNVWKEKGFNWLLGTFPIGKNVKGGGGTVGNQATYHSQNYPIQQNGIPVGSIPGGPPGAGSITAGNRLGASAVTANTLDTLLGGYFAPSTGILALAGVLTNPQFQVVLRALNQKKGVDLLSSPKVTVSSGKKATIIVARDFPYPDEYLPPQVPQSQGGGINPAIPSTPSTFKRRNVGVELEVEPLVSSDQRKIELKLSPQVVEFQGFVNYGNPIFSQAPNIARIGQGVVTGSTTQVLLTENTINQPIFSVRQVNTQVTLHSGQTIVLGGLMREDVQQVKDKTPIVGDIPLVGKLFRSSSEQHIKKNLLIFVTVWLIDPSGKKIKK